MNDISMTTQLKAFNKFILFFVIVCIIFWFIFVDYRIYAAGLILGSLVSYINSYYLSMKIRQLAQAVVNKTGKRFNLGFFTRASIAILAGMWALVSDQLHVGTTIAGMLFTPVALMLLGILAFLKKRS